MEAAASGIRHYGPEGQTTPEDLVDQPTVRVFIESHGPPPQMWIFGAVDFTAALARVAKVLGYRVTVCDAREVFATRRRFPMADEVLVTWPAPVFDERGDTLGPRDAVCVLTHDAKFDVPAIVGALATRVGYIGVMGSRRTHDTADGSGSPRRGSPTPDELERLHSPIGLDIGARTPEETAVSICAEIIAQRTGRRVPSLRDSTAPSTPERRSRSRAGVGAASGGSGAGSPKRTEPDRRRGDRVDLDGATGLHGMDDRIADAEVEHHVAGVLHEVAGLGGGTVERCGLADL